MYIPLCTPSRGQDRFQSLYIRIAILRLFIKRSHSHPSSDNIPFIPPKRSQPSTTTTTHQNSQCRQYRLCARNITPGFCSSGPDTNSNRTFDSAIFFESIGPFEDILISAVVACDKEEGRRFLESRVEMSTSCSFCENRWLGDDEEFSLNCVNCGRTRIVDVICTFPCLTST
jgi:hypothetical protein